MYLSFVPESCVVPIWYRMSMVESEERPFNRPNSRGLFKSTETDVKAEISATVTAIKSIYFEEALKQYVIKNKEKQKKNQNLVKAQVQVWSGVAEVSHD